MLRQYFFWGVGSTVDLLWIPKQGLGSTGVSAQKKSAQNIGDSTCDCASVVCLSVLKNIIRLKQKLAPFFTQLLFISTKLCSSSKFCDFSLNEDKKCSYVQDTKLLLTSGKTFCFKNCIYQHQ